MKINDIICTISLISVFIIGGCTNDKLDEPMNNCGNLTPTYDADVKTIIELSCALSGCHVNGTSAPGNFITYDGISRYLSNGSFENRVFDVKNDPVLGMPPDNSPGPKDLSTAQLQILVCWMENNYPEN